MRRTGFVVATGVLTTALSLATLAPVASADPGVPPPTGPHTQAAPDDDGDVLAFADLRMDLSTREVLRGNRPVELTRTEFTLLEMLLAHPRQVLTREQILKAVWGFDFEPTSNSLDVYVMYLRRKTEAGGEPRLVGR